MKTNKVIDYVSELLEEADFLYERLKGNDILETVVQITNPLEKNEKKRKIFTYHFNNIEDFRKYYIDQNDSEDYFISKQKGIGKDTCERFESFIKGNCSTGVYDFDITLAIALAQEYNEEQLEMEEV